MNNEVTVLTNRIGEALADQVSHAKNRLTLTAPFIKRKALERLLGGLGAAVELTIVTRWSADEIIAGVTDLSVLDFVRDRGHATLLLHPRLHAKVLLVDDLAVVGSANVTDVAFGFSERPNAEAVTVLRTAPNILFQFLSQLERESVVATEELRQRFEEATKAGPPPWKAPEVELIGPPARTSPWPFPRFRNPERLYSGYLSILDFGDGDIRASILDDLATLNLPEGLDEPGFQQRVGAALLAIPLIAEFDVFVMQPRYFGAMVEWMKGKGVLPDHGPEERERYLQTLVRWLRHFLPGRYRLEEPNYSELFGRVEGWN
jgi:hypothetical protein